MEDALKRIKLYLKEHGIKQIDIAAKGNFTKGFVSNVLSGKTPISSSFLQALTDITGKSTSYWLFGEEQYNGLASLNKLIDTFIQTGEIKEDGTYDDDIEIILKTMLNKEIRVKLQKKKEQQT